MLSHDGECFITNLTRSRLEEKPDGQTLVIERDEEFLKRLTRSEQNRYLQSKKETLEILIKFGLAA